MGEQSQQSIKPFFNLTTGSINGGGGGGGRIGIYHTGENHFTGEFLIHGGSGTSGYGGSGTLYLEDQTDAASPNKHLTLDNGGYTASDQIEEVEKIDLTKLSWDSTQFGFYSYNDIHIHTDNSSDDIPNLGLLTDGRLSTSYYYPVDDLMITVEIPHLLFVDHVTVYPTCHRYFQYIFVIFKYFYDNI